MRNGLAIGALALLAASCGDDDGGAGPAPGPDFTVVENVAGGFIGTAFTFTVQSDGTLELGAPGTAPLRGRVGRSGVAALRGILGSDEFASLESRYGTEEDYCPDSFRYDITVTLEGVERGIATHDCAEKPAVLETFLDELYNLEKRICPGCPPGRF